MGLFDRLIGGRMLAQDGGNNIVYAPDDDHWYGADGKVTTSGVKITPDMALKASGLYACVSILAKTMASLHLKMYKRLPEGGNEPAPYHPLDEIIRYQPNNIQTAAEFWETMMFHAVLRGNAYAEIIPGTRGSVDQLRSLHTDRVRVEYMKDHTLRFQVSDPVSGRTRVLLQEEVFRIPGLSSDGVTGLRAIDLVAESVGLGIAADRYASRIFSNAFNIGGFINNKTRKRPQEHKRGISARIVAGRLRVHQCFDEGE